MESRCCFPERSSSIDNLPKELAYSLRSSDGGLSPAVWDGIIIWGRRFEVG